MEEKILAAKYADIARKREKKLKESLSNAQYDFSEIKDILYVHYNKCHIFTHGNGLTFKYPILYIRDLCAGVGMVLLGIADEINKIKKMIYMKVLILLN